MNWENRFSSMVNESMFKIDEAKKRLDNFGVSNPTNFANITSSSVPSLNGSQNAQQSMLRNTNHFDIPEYSDLGDPVINSSDNHGNPSRSLLHVLYEKIEKQNQAFQFLSSKFAIMERQLNNQQKEMIQLKDQLSTLIERIEDNNPKISNEYFEKFKEDVHSELNKIKSGIPEARNNYEFSKYPLERRFTVNSSKELLDSIEEIKSRLGKIELNVSKSQVNDERNCKVIEKNASVLADWRSENMESMNHLSKLQDLSIDEVKHLRSRFYNVQDKIHELEQNRNDASINYVFSRREDQKHELDLSLESESKRKNSYQNLMSDSSSSYENSSKESFSEIYNKYN
ncbi:uncharacterized protein LOC124436861 isoform X2 [Xenia sp. Carnegie-2017]|uniref:uncharacterized protein LOC124436861 isoform X2 n=1 Tax=Xenia sp. Carnegie-2017 TaxID=2897299 RepID=UPI001F04D160|nr:uncharacterized protein LOC124436861 isoform X2 [Xenia sp. Carnegie-2017]